jgi:GNAT superfamily N-acetyltransferase
VRTPITFRPAVPADAPRIADFNLRLALETEDLKLDPATVRAGVEAVLADRTKGVYFVAEADGQVVGQCSVTYEWSDWCNGMLWWLQSVFVETAFRGRSIFKGLFRHVEEVARIEGAAGLRLYVEETNAAAQAAYTRLGMVRTHYHVFEKLERARVA